MASFPLAIRLPSIQPPQFRPQLVLKGLAIATAVVGLAIMSAYIWLLQFSPLALMHHSAKSPDILRLAPRQSVVAVALDAPLVDIERLQRYLTPLSKRGSVRRHWRQWLAAGGDGPLSDFLSATQLDFARDIQPWMGEESLLAIATLPPEQSDYFVALSTDDLDRSNLMLNVLWRQQYLQQQTPQVEVYKGVQLLNVAVANRNWVVGALGDRYTIFATGVDVAREAIDSWQVDELSLASTADYRSARRSSQGPQVGSIYSNLPAEPLTSTVWGLSLDLWGLTTGAPAWMDVEIEDGKFSLVSLHSDIAR
ncbi:MAG: DUF3352 domain-containing protein [Synechococcus sp.]